MVCLPILPWIFMLFLAQAGCVFQIHVSGENGNGNLQSTISNSTRECSSYHKYSNASSNRCTYVTQLPKCQFDDGYLAYIRFVMCTFPKEYRAASYVVLFIWLLYLFVALGVTAEEFFCPCLKTISKVMRMSDSLAGVTLLALGNGAPDIFSVIAAVNNSDPKSTQLAFQELFGAGIFVTTVVAGFINIYASFKMARRPFLRDNLFYLAAIIWTFIVMYKRDIKTAEAIGFIVLYLAYVSIVIFGQCINRRIRSDSELRRRRKRFKRLETVAEDDEEDDLSAPSPSPSPPPQVSHPRHRIIRDIDEGADFSSFDYSADVAHLFKENRHSVRTPNVVNTEFSQINEPMLIYIVQPTNFAERLTGINKVDWKCLSLPWKMFAVVKVPIMVVLAMSCPVVDIDVEGQKWDKWLTIWHCVTSPVFCVFAMGFGLTPVYNDFLVYHVVLMAGAVLSLVIYFVTSSRTIPKFHAVFALIGFLVAVLWIKIIAQEIVNLLETFGWITGLSYGIMGLTFLAWGNSIGDFISNLTMAKNGAPRMAIAACYGGPLLNMLLGVGISCTMSAIKNHGDKPLIRGTTQYILSAIFLAVSLLSAIIILPLCKFVSSKYIGFYLMVLYGGYLMVSIFHEAGFLNI